MTEADRDVLRTIIREELHAVLAELETARVRRSAALEELVRNEAAEMSADYPSPIKIHVEHYTKRPLGSGWLA